MCMPGFRDLHMKVSPTNWRVSSFRVFIAFSPTPKKVRLFSDSAHTKFPSHPLAAKLAAIHFLDRKEFPTISDIIISFKYSSF